MTRRRIVVYQGIRSFPVTIDTDDALLQGDVALPYATHGIVLFAHGSGSCFKATGSCAVEDLRKHVC